MCWHGRGSRPARSRLLLSRNIQEVVQLSEDSEAPRPTQEICPIQFTSAPLQNGESIFIVPRTTDFEFLNDEVLWSNYPVVVALHSLLSPASKDLTIMRIPWAQKINCHTPAQGSQLTRPEQRVRFSPGLIHHHGCPRHRGSDAFHPPLTDHHQEIDVESGSRPTPHTQGPGPDQRVRHSRPPEAVRGSAQSVQQLMTRSGGHVPFARNRCAGPRHARFGPAARARQPSLAFQ